MEKENKLDLRELNAIGAEIGYPFYVFADGSYGKSFVNGRLNAKMAVRCPFGSDNLSGPVGGMYMRKKEKIIPMPQPLLPPPDFAARIAQKEMAEAECGGKIYASGTVISCNGFCTGELAGYFLWVNPDINAPIGYRALCAVPKAKEMQMLAYGEDAGLKLNQKTGSCGKTNTAILRAAFEISKLNCQAWEYIGNYAAEGFNPGDCFMMSWDEMQAAFSANGKVVPLLGLLYGTGVFPCSSYDPKYNGLKAVQIMADGGYWDGTIGLEQSLKILPCFWI